MCVQHPCGKGRQRRDLHISRRRVVALEPGQPRYRILIADEQEDNRQLLLKLLAPLGFDLRETVNGQEAAEIWNKWHPHLIWMDVRMPVMNSISVAKMIREEGEGQSPKLGRSSSL
ncbi:MAG: hypothetical protein B6245_22405 [Desulfobacteraceae bacterium 4572_88]|nr:MAG: hypothetical protein B6245_22405 [Desulfobacteraceae bacterium 4572_88]